MLSYRTVLAPADAEYVDRRSRFLATVYPVASAQAAEEALRARRSQYWDAKHHVWACRLLEGQIERCSDDAEPHGTAGKPALEILAGRELWNVLVIVTRYFGGTLLGTGGLVQAYAGSTRLAVEAARVAEMRPAVRFCVTCGYGQYDALSHLLTQAGAKTEDATFTDRVTVRGRVETAAFPALEEALRARFGSGVSAERTGETLEPFEI